MLTQGTKVLITGGAGFIGSHVARALSASGCIVRVLDDLSTGRRDRIAALDGIEFLQADVRNPAAVHRAMHGRPSRHPPRRRAAGRRSRSARRR